jgi:transcriptional antiterminator RfaH
VTASSAAVRFVEDVAVPQWYAVWTRNQCEGKVEDTLRQKGLSVFLPAVQVPSRRRDRRVVLAQPLFPGYLFLRFAPSRESYISVASTDGVVRILGERWDALHAVADEQIEAVRRMVTDGAGARAVPWINVGDPVEITGGPLAGTCGRVREWRAGRATFVVSVDLLQRSVAAEVDAALIRRV